MDVLGTQMEFLIVGDLCQMNHGHTHLTLGIFSYYCVIHPWMEGVVVVEQKIPDYPD